MFSYNKIYKWRFAQVRKEMQKRNISALILSDSVNIRYTTGTKNMQVFTSRNALARYLLLTEDTTILYEFTGCRHLADGFETINYIGKPITEQQLQYHPSFPASCKKG